jgi:WhiB family transcriptional regulator, redox-sensing transcriptional regulator
MTDITESTQVDREWMRGMPAAARGDSGGGARHAAASATWMSRGACRDEDPELFFPVAAQGSALSQISAARAVCRRCAVVATCLAYALQTSQAGIWGGTTQEERRAMRERHRRSAAEQVSRLTVPVGLVLPGPRADQSSGGQGTGMPSAPAALESAQATARPAGKGPRS